jgi:hypothetical protein
MFDSMRTAHIAVFVISLGWALLLWLVLARPMLRRAGKESRQIAEMLSQLPAEMDVEGLVGQVLVKSGGSCLGGAEVAHRGCAMLVLWGGCKGPERQGKVHLARWHNMLCYEA